MAFSTDKFALAFALNLLLFIGIAPKLILIIHIQKVHSHPTVPFKSDLYK